MPPITAWMRKDSHQSNLFVLQKGRKFADPWRVHKRVKGVTLHKPRELTSEEYCRAQALANIKLNYQRPDEGLIKQMREKNAALVNQAAKSSAPSASPTSSTLLSSQIDQFASNLLVPQISSSNVFSIISQPSPSAQPLSGRQDWEDLAKKGIAHKALSLNKAWDRKTWKQKANNIERLKLLKDDGCDITSLEVKGTSADVIITALLAHIKARKENNVGVASTAVAPAAPVLPSATSEEVSEPAQEDSCDGHATPIAANGEGEISDERSRMTAAALLFGVVPQKVPEAARRKMERQLCVPSPLAGTKRKHAHDDEHQPDWSELSPQKALHDSYNEAKTNALVEPPCTCCMYDKIMRVMTRKETSKAFEEQAFDVVKRRIGRDIFRYSRAARRVPQTKESPSFSQYITLNPTFSPQPPSKPSRIVLQLPASPAHQPSELHACISANGMDLIMKELKHIAYGCNEDGSLYITDPEEAEDREGDRLMEAGETEDEHFRYHIHLSTTPALQMVIEGETMALVGLVRRLHESELTHCHRWQYDADRMEVIADDSVPWRLSDATQSALEDLEMLLEAGQTLGGVEVRLGYLGSPEKTGSG